MARPFRTLTLLIAALLLASATAQREGWPSSLTIGTASVGGNYFIYGGGWANLIQQELGVSTSTEVTGGPNQNMLLVQNQNVELGMVTMGPAWEGWTGEGDWTGGVEMRDVRALFPMYGTPFHIITLAGSGIDTVEGLQGRAVGVGPAGGTPGTYFPRFFEQLGIDIRVRQAGASDLASQLMDGQIDGFAFAAGIPIASFLEIEAQRSANIFTFDEEQQEQLLEAFFYLGPDTIPASAYTSLDEDLVTVGMYNVAIGHADLPEDFVYEMVKTVLENQQFLIDTHQSAEETVPENMLPNNAFLWLHPGAIRYFEEIGISIPEALIPPEYSPAAGN
ncbi:TAXI family TRAP transporter solute-binding subunit [soil metagenome]